MKTNLHKQAGHFDLSFIGWTIGIAGAVIAGGGIWLVVVAARMLR